MTTPSALAEHAAAVPPAATAAAQQPPRAGAAVDALSRLKQFTTVVADTGDFELLARYAPTDATTNPSLILKAAQQPAYRGVVDAALAALPAGADAERRHDALLRAFGRAILARIPGRVSTEVDARLSFDRARTVERALRLVEGYEAEGVPRSRVLIKIAATWEGIGAARELERRGIGCNLTLLFGFAQAAACADAGVTLISPFVGRIYDWHKKVAGGAWDEAAMAGANDPGVRSVRRIHAYYKQHGYRTEVMAASFRNTGQILALAGCDLLTISPELLAQLQALPAGDPPFAPALGPAAAGASGTAEPRWSLLDDEPAFRLALNDDAMASDKLAEGIRLFAADAGKLDALLAASSS